MLLLKNAVLTVATEEESRAIILQNVANLESVAAEMDGRCVKCGIPRFGKGICAVCCDMINAIRSQPGLHAASVAWEEENNRRANYRRQQSAE
jgi:hypothetical protein